MGRTSRRPAGADNFLRWRRSVTEHLETRRLTWPEYGMFHWLCVKASPYTGVLRISWPVLAVQTGLSPAYVARLCRRLRDKRYVGYASRPGRRDGLIELVVDKFPLPGALYTDLSACFRPGAPADGEPAAGPAEHAPAQGDGAARPGPPGLPAELPADVGSEVGSELGSDASRQLLARSGDSARPRRREEERKKDYAVTVRPLAHPTALAGPEPDRTAALAAGPPPLRETLARHWNGTSGRRVSPEELDGLVRLSRTHTPAVIQTAISTAVARAAARGRPPGTVTLADVRASLPHVPSRRGPGVAPPPAAARPRPPGVTRLE